MVNLVDQDDGTISVVNNALSYQQSLRQLLTALHHGGSSSGGVVAAAGSDTSKYIVVGNDVVVVEIEENESIKLCGTLATYWGAFSVVFVLFCILRQHCPSRCNPFNTRSWVTNIQSDLAKKQFGYISWTYRIASIPDVVMMKECGMDGVCFSRICGMGIQLCLVGMVCSLVLIPIYYTAPNSRETIDVTDWVKMMTTANVAPGSWRFAATVAASYVVFGYTMKLLLNELQWFTTMRHKFLAQPLARNYSIYVRNLPSEYQSNTALYEFFHANGSQPLQVHVVVRTNNLRSKVAQRQDVVYNLEHAIAESQLAKDGSRRPRHSTILDVPLPVTIPLGGEVVDSIDYYTKQLHNLNNDIAQRIESLRQRLHVQALEQQEPMMATIREKESFEEEDDENEGEDIENNTTSLISSTRASAAEDSSSDSASSSSSGSAADDDALVVRATTDEEAGGTEEHNSARSSSIVTRLSDVRSTMSKSLLEGTNRSKRLLIDGTNATKEVILSGTNATREVIICSTNATKEVIISGTNATKEVIISGVNLVIGEEDGKFYSAGFVSFQKLAAVQTALQQNHIDVPYAMECLEAPDPQDIFWINVGREHEDLEFWRLISIAATTSLCLFWTIPVSFVSSLASVDGLRNHFGPVDEILDKNPELEPVFAVFAPQLLVILNAALRPILEVFAKLEGPISGAIVEASLFFKLSVFMIIQTFFVSAISGGIFEELDHLIHDVTAIVDLLAKSLPGQSTYFMQMAVIITVTNFTLEALRIYPLGVALLRRFIGPRLTEKERSREYMGLAPINVGTRFARPDYLADLVLFFVIFLVYAVISPLVSFVLYGCFAVMGTLLRHQFVYIYSRPDSGGVLYLNFMSILTSCLLIGELTVIGLISMKKSSATVFMGPLLVATVLFNNYVRQQHMNLSQRLPTKLCNEEDRKNVRRDFRFGNDEYLQPEMRERTVLPEVSEELKGEPSLIETATAS